MASAAVAHSAMRALTPCSTDESSGLRAMRSRRATCCGKVGIVPADRIRVLVVVGREGSRTSPRTSTPSSHNLARSRSPFASSPMTPMGMARAPSATRLCAGLPAPPGTMNSRASSNTGIGASRERRVACPTKYSSSARSPTTRTRREARRERAVSSCKLCAFCIPFTFQRQSPT